MNTNTQIVTLIQNLATDMIRCGVDQWTIVQECSWSYKCWCGHDPAGLEMRWVQDLIGGIVASNAIAINSDRDPAQDNIPSFKP